MSIESLRDYLNLLSQNNVITMRNKALTNLSNQNRLLFKKVLSRDANKICRFQFKRSELEKELNS